MAVPRLPRRLRRELPPEGALIGLLDFHQWSTPSGAVLSTCERYRYVLWRWWDRTLPPLVVDMLNPSTADGSSNDATVIRLIHYAQANGFGGLIVVNLYAYRATHPRDLRNAYVRGVDIVGPENRKHVDAAFCLAAGDDFDRYVMAAWGSTTVQTIGIRIAEHDRIRRARFFNLEWRAILVSNGYPCHPLVRRKVHPVPIPWSVAT